MKRHVQPIPNRFKTICGTFELIKTEQSPFGVILNTELLVEHFFDKYDLKLIEQTDLETIISLTTRLAIEDNFWYPVVKNQRILTEYLTEKHDLIEVLAKYSNDSIFDCGYERFFSSYINFIRDELEQRSGILLSNYSEIMANEVHKNIVALYRKKV